MLSLIISKLRKEEADFLENLAKIDVRGHLLGMNRFNNQPGVTEYIDLLDVQISFLGKALPQRQDFSLVVGSLS